MTEQPPLKPQVSIGKRSAVEKRTQDAIKKLEEKKYQDNHLKELERRRFQEAKARLKDFVVSMPLGQELDQEDQDEMGRLLRYYKHRYVTFCSILKEALTARRAKGPQMLPKKSAKQAEEAKGEIRVFSLKPSAQVKGQTDLSPEE